MRPYIARLRVDAEDGLEAGQERVELGPVAADEVVVVFQPARQVVVVDDAPTLAPHRPHELLGVFGRLSRYGQNLRTGRRARSVVVFGDGILKNEKESRPGLQLPNNIAYEAKTPFSKTGYIQ